jgi:hypothetical protein
MLLYSGRLGDVVQDQEVRARAGRYRVSASVIVAEFHERRLVVKLFDNCAYLPAYEPLRGNVRQQCYRGQ